MGERFELLGGHPVSRDPVSLTIGAATWLGPLLLRYAGGRRLSAV